jgi:hypothetical protein
MAVRDYRMLVHRMGGKDDSAERQYSVRSPDWTELPVHERETTVA